MIAHGVQIFDNDSHPLDASLREREYGSILDKQNQLRPEIASSSIFVGERVWIGLHSVVLKGVSIGDGSIVAAGSVVTSDVPANSLVAGNPATVIRRSVVSHLDDSPS